MSFRWSKRLLFLILCLFPLSVLCFTSRTVQASKISPVLIILGSHGDQKNGFLEREADTTRVVAFVEERFKDTSLTSDEKIHVWIENSALPRLGPTISANDAEQSKLYQLLAAKFNLPLEVLLKSFLNPEEMDDKTRAQFVGGLQTIYDEALATQADDIKNGKLTVPFFAKPVEWLNQKFGKKNIILHVESAPFEAWFEMLRFNLLEDRSIPFLSLNLFDLVLKNEYACMVSLIRSLRLRDQALATQMDQGLKQTPGERHVILRGLIHTNLSDELRRLGIQNELRFVGDVRETTPFQQHVAAYLQSGKNDFDIDHMTPEDRKFITLGMMTRLVETYLVATNTPLSFRQRRILFDKMIELSEPQIEEWKTLLAQAVKKGGLTASIETVAWLRKINSLFEEALPTPRKNVTTP